jgi:transposase
LPDSREGTCWQHVLQTLVCYRLIDPGSEWRLHRLWFGRSAMGDLLGEDYSVVEKNALYRCLDKVLEHKQALFGHLTERWQDLFGAKFDVLLYDLTSTYFESSEPVDDKDKRRYGYSRDKRPDCVQVVIALIVTPEGFPLAYEVLAGNTSDRTTLREFLNKIETQYGKAERIWVMDRGIPTEEVLSEMRRSNPPVYYLVGTPKGRLSQLEQKLLGLPFTPVRSGVEVKLLAHDQELYVLAKSHPRIDKERAMRHRQLRALIKRLKELQQMKLTNAQALLLKLGAAKGKYPSAWRLIDIVLPEAKILSANVTFSFRLNRQKLRAMRRREGRYLLRTNLSGKEPAQLWQFYI